MSATTKTDFYHQPLVLWYNRWLKSCSFQLLNKVQQELVLTCLCSWRHPSTWLEYGGTETWREAWLRNFCQKILLKSSVKLETMGKWKKLNRGWRIMLTCLDTNTSISWRRMFLTLSKWIHIMLWLPLTSFSGLLTKRTSGVKTGNESVRIMFSPVKMQQDSLKPHKPGRWTRTIVNKCSFHLQQLPYPLSALPTPFMTRRWFRWFQIHP